MATGEQLKLSEDEVIKQKLKDEEKLKKEEIKDAIDGLDISKIQFRIAMQFYF